MLICSPEVAYFISDMIDSRQIYRCLVDGRDEFRGEPLPVGTKTQVLSWIKVRYKVVGDLFVVTHGYPQGRSHCIYYSFDPYLQQIEPWLPRSSVIRYLVEADGVERMFVLKPFPDGLLEWRPPRQLTMMERCATTI